MKRPPATPRMSRSRAEAIYARGQGAFSVVVGITIAESKQLNSAKAIDDAIEMKLAGVREHLRLGIEQQRKAIRILGKAGGGA